MTIKILQGSCLDVLPTLAAGSVHCCVTSPPYWGLRDYGTATWEGGSVDCDHIKKITEPHETIRRDERGVPYGPSLKQNKTQHRNACKKCGAVRVDNQIGLEATPDEFVATMVAVFSEVKRVLRDDGTLWLNLGDSYAAGGANDKNKGNNGSATMPSRGAGNLKPKDLCGIPWRVALALQADGWYLRSDIIWHKPSPMPESVRDRPTKAHEYIFLLTKQPRYYYDAEAIKEANSKNSHSWNPRKSNKTQDKFANTGNGHSSMRMTSQTSGRNKRDVWTVASTPYAAAHFATFPPELIRPCILAGAPLQCCSACGNPWQRLTKEERHNTRPGNTSKYNGTGMQNAGESMQKRQIVDVTTLGFEPACECGHAVASKPGVVLDPFYGSGTTGQVAQEAGCDAIGIELNAEYVKLAEKRTAQARLF